MAPPTATRRAPPPPSSGADAPPLTAQDRQDNADATDGAAEDGGSRRGDTQLPNQGQARDPLETGITRQEPIRMSPHDDQRSTIAARFRRTTPENERPFNGDMTQDENTMGEVGAREDDDLELEAIRRADLAQQGLDPDIVGDELDPSRTQHQDDEPVRKKLKVRGREMELTDDEILEAAQKTLAADSYLEEARTLLNEAKKIRGQRTAQDRSTTGDQTGTQDELEPPELDDGTNTPEPTFKTVVEKIQFGDPEEAAKELERLVDKTSTKRANEGQLQRAFDQDFARSKKALTAFTEANPDLAKDEITAMAIEAQMYGLYREDIKALGLEDDQIPKDRNAIANWHRFYRVNGYEVRPTSALLEAAKDKFLKWRGGGQQGQQGQQPRKAQPRVEVNVNRDTRRANIPNQPSRASVPRRDPVIATRKTGSDVVADMRRSRGQA